MTIIEYKDFWEKHYLLSISVMLSFSILAWIITPWFWLGTFYHNALAIPLPLSRK